MAFSSRGNERARFTTKRLGYRTTLTGIFFASRRIHVYVDDVNEFIPLWSEQEYNGQLEEGDLSSFILQVEKINTETEIDIILDFPRLRPLTTTARPAMAMSASIPFPVQRMRRCSQWTSRASSPTPSPCGPGLFCVSRLLTRY